MTVPSPDEPELVEVTDGLYGLDPSDFVAARNDIVRRLRKGGDRHLARLVAGLRRPSPAAWAVNQLARRRRADLEDLLFLGDALRQAQAQTLGGADAADLRGAGRARRQAVARLADAAVGLLAERGPDAAVHHPEIAATLEAASLDARAGVEASSGRLTSALEPPSGFGDLGLDLAPLGTDPPPADAERRVHEPIEAASGADDDAEADVTRLQRTLDEARRSVDARRRDADEAQRAAEQAEAAAAEAFEHLRAAERRVDDLRAR